MYEILAVLVVYTIVSFAGMAILWTVAAQKGVVRAPRYFVWIKSRDLKVAQLATPSEPDSLQYSNVRPLGFAAASLLLAASVISPPYAGGRAISNQTGKPNSLISCPS